MLWVLESGEYNYIKVISNNNSYEERVRALDSTVKQSARWTCPDIDNLHKAADWLLVLILTLIQFQRPGGKTESTVHGIIPKVDSQFRSHSHFTGSWCKVTGKERRFMKVRTVETNEGLVCEQMQSSFFVEVRINSFSNSLIQKTLSSRMQATFFFFFFDGRSLHGHSPGMELEAMLIDMVTVKGSVQSQTQWLLW